MSVKIRLKRTGARKRPFYRIVVVDSRAPRDGRPIEEIGYYGAVLPASFTDRERIRVATERVDYWVSKGAQVSETVKKLIKRVSADTQNDGKGAE